MGNVVNVNAIAPNLIAMSGSRGGLAVISDSNGRFNGYGIQNGLIAALRDRLPQYATGAIPADTQTATAWGSGAGESYTRTGTAYGYSGANAALDTYMDPDVTDVADRYVYYNGAAAAYIDNQHSYVLVSTSHNLYRYQKTTRYHFTYGTFPSGTNSIRPGLARSATMLAKATAINTNTGAYGLADASFDYDNQTYTGPANGSQSLSFHIGDLDANLNPGTFILYRTVEAPEITSGFQCTLFMSMGGKSARALAIGCNTTDPEATRVEMSEAQFVEKIRQCVRLQAGRKRLIVLINTGLNDRNETLTSVGPAAVADGDSPEAYRDNLHQIVIKWRAAWATLGYIPSDLSFLIAASHSLDPDHSELISYRRAADELAGSLSDVCSVNLAGCVPGSTMTANGWYDAPGDPGGAHLTNAGYDGVMRAMMAEIYGAMGGWRGRPSRSRLAR